MPTSIQLYSYPPHALFVGLPFALLPYYLALALWSILGIAFFAWAARPYLPKGFPPILAALTPAACINLWDGHYGLMLGALWLLFFRWYKELPGSAGAVAAAMTIKPHLGLAIALTAMTRRKVVLTASLGTLLLVILSALAFGAQSWCGFLFNTSSVHSELLRMSGDAFYFRMIPSAYVTWGRGALGVTAQIAVIAATAALLWRHRRWDAFIASTATILVIPYSLNYDLTVLCLGAIILMWRHWDEMALPQRIAVGAAFLSPNLTFLWPIAWTTPIVLLLFLNLQLRFAEREARAS
jgi:hypothetical protein